MISICNLLKGAATLLLLGLYSASYAQCPSIINYNSGNGGAANCPGVGTAMNTGFTATPYAYIPVSTKTGGFTTRWATGSVPSTIPAIAGFWQGATKLPDTAGPASQLTTSGGNSDVDYCLYGPTNLPNSGTFTVLFVNPTTGANMFSCAYTKSGGTVSATTPPSISSQPTSQIGCIGYKSSFSVTAAPGSAGTLTYQWMKNGIDISGATSATYTINAVSASDTGTSIYSVAVTESNGAIVVSNSVSLTLNNQTTFNGGTSNWATAGNWSGGSVPDSTVHVYIPASASNMPNVNSGTVKCKCLTIQSGATLTVNGGTIEIAGRINNSGTFDAGNGTVVINGTTVAQTIPANTFTSNTINNLTIANTTGVTLGGTLNIKGVYTPTSGTLTTGGFLTLKSTSSAGTARIAGGSTSGGYISGNVTTERYIPAATNRAWRLLAPVTAGTQTIQSAWQEGATSISSNPNPTYGTLITCNGSYTTGAGFDAVMPSNSILAYDANNQSWTSNPVTNTNTKQLASEQGYFLYIRGDRTITPSTSISGAGSTTLRSTGTLRQGNQSAVTVPAGGFALVGNPYASPIDFSLIASGDRPNIGNKFWVWDPKLTGTYGLGAYVLFDAATSTPWTPSVTGGSYNTPNSVILSGMAFFVQSSGSAGSITLKESHKTTGSTNAGFKNTGTTEELHIGLSAMKPDTTWAKADGAFVLFNSAFSDTVDADDAGKPINFGENMGLLRNGKTLALEARPAIATDDTVQIRMWKMKQTKYSFAFTPANFSSNTTAKLFDNFTKDSSSIDLTNASSFDFEVTTDTASASQTRFFITYHKDPVITGVNGTATKNMLAVAYPNPTSGSFTVSIQQADAGIYNFELYNITGQKIFSKKVSHNGGALQQNLTAPNNSAAGTYKLLISKNNHHYQTIPVIIK